MRGANRNNFPADAFVVKSRRARSCRTTSPNSCRLAFRHTPLSCGVVFGQQPDELDKSEGGCRERKASFGVFAGFVHVSTSSSTVAPRMCATANDRGHELLAA